jgi:hypothetical protein
MYEGGDYLIDPRVFAMLQMVGLAMLMAAIITISVYWRKIFHKKGGDSNGKIQKG